MGWRLKAMVLWGLLVFGQAVTAFAAGDPCGLSRAVIAGETALRDALSQSDGNAAPLLAALARLAGQANGQPEITAYISSRQEIAATLSLGDGLAARRLMRLPPHDLIGQAALIAARADSRCAPELAENETPETSAQRDGGQIAGGHGGVATPGASDAAGNGQAARPGGRGLETSPLSFLRGFDTALHVIPTIGATLAFGALIFALTRDRRQYRRYLCHMPVDVVAAERQGTTTTMLDLSRGGAKLARTGNWDVGDRLRVGLDGTTAKRAARVVWANEGFAGILFRKPLTTSEFQSLLTRARAGAGAAERQAF